MFHLIPPSSQLRNFTFSDKMASYKKDLFSKIPRADSLSLIFPAPTFYSATHTCRLQPFSWCHIGTGCEIVKNELPQTLICHGTFVYKSKRIISILSSSLPPHISFSVPPTHTLPDTCCKRLAQPSWVFTLYILTVLINLLLSLFLLYRGTD